MPGKEKQKGVAAVLITILVLAVMFAIAMSFAVLTAGQERISGNAVRASQAYYAAETGMEDALLRLRKFPGMTSLSYTINIGGETISVNIPDSIGGLRTITSEGSVKNSIKKVQAVYKVESSGLGFYYGVQVGEGGLEMGNNSRIKGNVFSDGSVVCGGGASDKGFIDNNVVVAKNGNKIKNISIGGDALAYSCESSTIGGDLTYVSGGSVSECAVGGSTVVRPDEIEPISLPISAAKIGEWKKEASDGGVVYEDVIFSGSGTNYLGAVQIGTPLAPRNLTVEKKARLKITGTVYVTGDIVIRDNETVIELDESYGFSSGIIIADGKINSGNNVLLRGSGQSGSYVLILSTNNSVDPNSPAILVSNNASGAIFYTSAGMIYLGNNMIAREITGYKVKMDNNAIVEYESGLQSLIFTSGPSASWKVENWKEIQ